MILNNHLYWENVYIKNNNNFTLKCSIFLYQINAVRSILTSGLRFFGPHCMCLTHLKSNHTKTDLNEWVLLKSQFPKKLYKQ